MEANKYELILTIINRGFSETVMDVARERGATGGTILHGRGTGAKEIAQFYNMVIEAEKELVLIIVPKEIRNNIMDGIMHTAGLGTEANGITVTLPVEDFVILSKIHGKETGKD